MKYIAHLKQAGEGCDYTIGCGHALIIVPGTNWSEVQENLVNIIKEEYTSEEREIESVTLYEVSGVIELDVDTIYREIRLNKKKEEEKRKEEKERRLLAELQQKYNK